jgi:hypothetical protein
MLAGLHPTAEHLGDDLLEDVLWHGSTVDRLQRHAAIVPGRWPEVKWSDQLALCSRGLCLHGLGLVELDEVAALDLLVADAGFEHQGVIARSLSADFARGAQQ